MVHKAIGILGGTGFVGGNLLTDRNPVRITKENLASVGKKYDVLVNANGNSKKQLPETDPLADFDLTVRNTLRSLAEFEYDTYVYVSSCEVYTGDTDEDATIDVSAVSRYGLSKYLAECLVKKYCKKWLILRLNGPVGPNMKKGPVYDIMSGNRLWVSAASRFQLVHTDYVNELLGLLLDRGTTNQIFNVTGYGVTTLGDVMTTLKKYVKAPDNPVIVHNVSVRKADTLLSVPYSLESVKKL